MRFRAILLVMCLYGTGTVDAQDLVTRLKNARTREMAEAFANRDGVGLSYRPVDPLGVQSDTIRAWIEAMRLAKLPPPPPPPVVESLTIDSIRVIRPLERVVFEERFSNARWTFFQGQDRIRLDTTRTLDIRARLQSRFGQPTATLAEVDSISSRTQLFQFEYWLIINDSAAVMLIDVNGPLERGLVVATDEPMADHLRELRRKLLLPLFDTEDRGRFVDYYFQRDTGSWFASGFDGATFFHTRISAPNLALGRPSLSTYVSEPPDR